MQKVKIDINNLQYTLFNVYGSNSNDTTFFKILDDEIAKTQCEKVIVGGDMNITVNPDIDKHGGRSDTD